LPEFLQQESGRRRILGTFLNGTNIRTLEFRPSDIVVIGNESNGISDEVAEVVTNRITIPSAAQCRETAESLNAAIAAALVMFAWR
jgi:TrmH family RNA methyltransferase